MKGRREKQIQQGAKVFKSSKKFFGKVEKTFLRKKQILWMGERKSLPGGRELSNR